MLYRETRITDRFKYYQDRRRKELRSEKRRNQGINLITAAEYSWIGKGSSLVNDPVWIAFMSTVTTFLAAYCCFGLVWWKFALIASSPYLLQLSFWIIKKVVQNLLRVLKVWDRVYDWFNRKNSGLET